MNPTTSIINYLSIKKISGHAAVKKQINLIPMADKINLLRKTAEELRKMGKDLPAVEKNTDRIMASVKMLELNISDPAELSIDSD